MIRPLRSTRRLLILVAAMAWVCSGLHASPCPGYYYRLPWTAIHVGGCRNDAEGVWLFAHGRQGTSCYQLGAWRPGNSYGMVLGVAWQDGRAVTRAGWRASIW